MGRIGDRLARMEQARSAASTESLTGPWLRELTAGTPPASPEDVAWAREFLAQFGVPEK